MDGSHDVPAGYDAPTDDAAEQYRPTRADLPDGLTDAEWLAGSGKKGIAADDPRRFGPADGLTITARIKARNARLNAWRCAYHLAPGHPDRWQRKGTKRPAKAPRRPVAETQAADATVRAGETREAYAARMLALWDAQCAADPQPAPEREPVTVEVPEADVIAWLEANDGNEVSRAMALAWCAADAAEGRA